MDFNVVLSLDQFSFPSAFFKKKFPSKNIMKFSGKIKSIWGNQQPFQEQILNPQSSPTSFIIWIATND